MKLVFLGTPEAAVPTLRALVAAGHDVLAVVTRPDRRRGRGGALSPSPVAIAARELGVPVHHRVSEVVDLGAEWGVVVAYGAIVPAAVLERLPMLNVHFSLLPRWRGAAPVERAILAGDEETGVSIMSLEPTLDTGPVHARARTPVAGKTTGELTAELATRGAELIVEVLADPRRLSEPVAQVGEATYAEKVQPDELRVRVEDGVARAGRRVLLERAFITLGGTRLRVVRAAASPASVPAGRLEAPDGHPTLGFPDGALRLEEVRPDGGRTMSGDAWWRGWRAGSCAWGSVDLSNLEP